MKRITLVFLLCLFFLSGCDFKTQDGIITECLTHNKTICSEEECMMQNLIGYNGYEQARANYFQCAYIDLLSKQLAEGFRKCQTN